MRTRAKVDTVQRAVVLVLRSVGATVTSLASVGKGCPDLVVGFRRTTYLLEVKTEPGDKLTPDEATWHEHWQGAPVAVVRGPADALRAVGAMGHHESKEL